MSILILSQNPWFYFLSISKYEIINLSHSRIYFFNINIYIFSAKTIGKKYLFNNLYITESETVAIRIAVSNHMTWYLPIISWYTMTFLIYFVPTTNEWFYVIKNYNKNAIFNDVNSSICGCVHNILSALTEPFPNLCSCQTGHDLNFVEFS